jgi:integrase
VTAVELRIDQDMLTSQHVAETADKHSLRDVLLWRMLSETAARAREILGLDVADLDMPNRSARVRRKGSAMDLVVWQTGTARMLTSAAAACKPCHQPLSISERGVPRGRSSPERAAAACRAEYLDLIRPAGPDGESYGAGGVSVVHSLRDCAKWNSYRPARTRTRNLPDGRVTTLATTWPAETISSLMLATQAQP